MSPWFDSRYTEIGDEEQTVYVGCIDPLCSHDKKECTAFSDAPNSQIALVPQNKGFMIYFFREKNDGKEPTIERLNADLLVKDIEHPNLDDFIQSAIEWPAFPVELHEIDWGRRPDRCQNSDPASVHKYKARPA